MLCVSSTINTKGCIIQREAVLLFKNVLCVECIPKVISLTARMYKILKYRLKISGKGNIE